MGFTSFNVRKVHFGAEKYIILDKTLYLLIIKLIAIIVNIYVLLFVFGVVGKTNVKQKLQFL